jgi:hypothetical protein
MVRVRMESALPCHVVTEGGAGGGEGAPASAVGPPVARAVPGRPGQEMVSGAVGDRRRGGCAWRSGKGRAAVGPGYPDEEQPPLFGDVLRARSHPRQRKGSSPSSQPTRKTTGHSNSLGGMQRHERHGLGPRVHGVDLGPGRQGLQKRLPGRPPHRLATEANRSTAEKTSASCSTPARYRPLRTAAAAPRRAGPRPARTLSTRLSPGSPAAKRSSRARAATARRSESPVMGALL